MKTTKVRPHRQMFPTNYPPDEDGECITAHSRIYLVTPSNKLRAELGDLAHAVEMHNAGLLAGNVLIENAREVARAWEAVRHHDVTLHPEEDPQ
jgi:hypothetical protein